jgi:triacylglycerol lipase
MLIGSTDADNGFRYSIEYFLANGYNESELYGSMWGFADIPREFEIVHYQAYVMRVRKFIEAVLDYTGATEIDVIAHSLGTTLARRALKGGWVNSKFENYYVGAPLTKKVRTFIGIAGFSGGNYLCSLASFQVYRLCNDVDGIFPGELARDNKTVVGKSDYLVALDHDHTREAQHTLSYGSTADAYAGQVFG